MKYVYVLMCMLLLTAGAMAATKTVYLTTSDGDPYFCNPCRYTYSNISGSTNGRTVFGADNFTFDGTSTEYNINVFAQMIGFNISETVVMGSSESEVTANFSRIPSRGAIAWVINSNNEDYYPVANNNDGVAYTYERLKNISYSLGYSGVNSFNGGNNYTATDTVSTAAFNSYDTVVISDPGTASSSMSTALDNAQGNGVKMVINGRFLASSSISISSIVQYTVEARSNSGGMKAGAEDGSGEFPEGYALEEGAYIDVSDIVGNAPGFFYSWFTDFGEQIYFDYEFLVRNAGAGSWWSYKSPMYSKYANWFIVPTGRYTGTTTIQHSPTIKALMYLVLDDFNTTSPFQNDLVLNIYEGTQQCGNVRPLENVLCCISSDCDVSSEITSDDVDYSSLVAPIDNPEISARGDATDPIVFWSSEYDYFSTVGYAAAPNTQAWEAAYLTLGEDEQRWFVYQDKNLKKSRVSHVGSRGSTDGQTHWLMNYDFYDTYIDTSVLSDLEFTMEALDASNSGELYFCRGEPFTESLGICIYKLDTCEAGDYWNMTMYYGENTSSFMEVGVNCINGSISRTSASGLTSIPGFDMTNINWYYGFAPDYLDFPNLIEYNDTRPMVFLQSNEQGAKYNWARHLVVTKFRPQYLAGSGDLTDTGGYISMENNTLYYIYTKFFGGNATLQGNGNEVLTCNAPSGYAFYNPSTDTYEETYVQNISLFTDISLGVSLQQQRKLRLGLHITSDTVEDIDNARCSIPGFTDSYSTNGYCYFDNVQPQTLYNVTIRTSGAEDKVVQRQVYIADYYDSNDADNNGIFCGNFDGNYTYEINIDHIAITLYPYVRTQDDGTNVGNAVVTIDDESCRTNEDGWCTLRLPYKTGLTYKVNITKTPQIIPSSTELYLSEMDCNKNDECSYIFFVYRNASYSGSVNDDISQVDLNESLSGIEIADTFIALFTNPLFIGLFLAMVMGWAGYSAMGLFGAVVGFGGGVGVGVTLFLLPANYLLFLVILMIFGIAVVAYLASQ